MLTKHPSYSFSGLAPYICVFCRNEENETKSKQFGQELSKLCKEEVVVATIGFYGRDYMSMQAEANAAKSRRGRDHRTCFHQTLSMWL